MAIKALYPKQLDLPHIGQASISFLTINAIIWVQENKEKPPYEFLADYLEKHAKLSDDGRLNTSALNQSQLDDIATAWGQSFEDRISTKDDSISITNAKEFKDYVIKRSDEAEKRSQEVMKKVFSQSGIGRLTKIISATQSPAQKLIAGLDPLGLKAIHRTLSPQWLESIDSARHITQAYQNQLKHIPDLSRITIGHNLANNLAFPSTDYALLAQQVTKQFRVSDLGISAIMDAHRIGRFSESFLTDALKLPGFNATARAGLVGLATKSASAEVLARYAGQNVSESTPIGVAMRAIKELDIIEPEDFDALTELTDATTQSIAAIKPAHKYNLIQILTLIIAVLSLIITLTDDSGETQKEILEEISALHHTLSEEFNAEDKAYKNDRILTGAFHLREGASTKTSSIMLLNKGRIVREKKIQDGWAFVEVLPYGDEESLYGWVYRGGLSKLP